jgi:hypothetical protein
MSALRELVVMNELGISTLRPAPWRCIDLIGEGAHSDRDGDHSLYIEEALLGSLAGVPVEARRRDCRLG